MTITRDSALDCSASVSSTTATATIPASGTATAGKLLTCMTFIYDAIANIQVPAGWNNRRSVEHNSQTFFIVLYDKIAAGGETGITVTKGGSAATMRLAFYQWSGAKTVAPWDTGNAAHSGGSQVQAQATGTTPATAQADELLLSGIILNGAAAGTQAWDNAGSPIHALSNADYTGARTVNAIGAYADTFRWTNTLFAAALMQSYMAAANTEDFIGARAC